MDMYDTIIVVAPASFEEEPRTRASEIATKRGKGLRMELHTSHTEFYADADVPIGKVAIYAPKHYKGMPEYVTTLDSPADVWPAPGERPIHPGGSES